MSKLFNFLKPVNNPTTKGFDLSKNQSFSFGAGMQIPAFYRMVMNKTHMELSLSNGIINTTPMINQPFARGQFYCDVFQVPLSQLWSEFNEFYAQARELISTSGETFESTQDMQNFEYQPVFSLPFVLTLCFHDIVQYYKEYAPSVTDYKNWTFANPSTYVNGEFMLGLDVHGYMRALGTLRLLDMLGYGNWYLMIKDIIVNDDSDHLDIENNTMTVILQQFFNLYLLPWFCGSDVEYDVPELIDIEGAFDFISDASFHGVTLSESVVLKPFGLVSPWPLLAYQKVFSDIYRNTFYDKSNVWSFNVDYWVKEYDGLIGDSNWYNSFDYVFSEKFYTMFASLFELHYRQFKKDMFTSLLPDSQFGDVATVSVGDSEFNIINKVPVSNPSGETVKAIGVGAPGLIPGSLYQNNVVGSEFWKLSPLPSFSVLAQRRAEALQRYKERYLRAGDRLSDQFKSMFGQVPYYLQDKYCRYLGSLDSNLKNNPVPATAETGDYTVGERASYGVSNINGKLSFDVADMSIVIALVYYLPEADYEAFNIDPIHTKLHYLDLPQIEFENLGLAPVYRNALSVVPTGVDDEVVVSGNPVLGYAPPYLEWKTDVDRLHGEFGSTVNMGGVFHTWVTSRGNVSMRSLSDYYVDPRFINSIMVSQFDGSQSRDPFLSFFMFDCKCVQPLTVTGLPIWD